MESRDFLDRVNAEWRKAGLPSDEWLGFAQYGSEVWLVFHNGRWDPTKRSNRVTGRLWVANFPRTVAGIASLITSARKEVDTWPNNHPAKASTTAAMDLDDEGDSKGGSSIEAADDAVAGMSNEELLPHLERRWVASGLPLSDYLRPALWGEGPTSVWTCIPSEQRWDGKRGRYIKMLWVKGYQRTAAGIEQMLIDAAAEVGAWPADHLYRMEGAASSGAGLGHALPSGGQRGAGG